MEETGIRGVITLGGVKYTKGGVTLVVNMDERARMDMVTAGNRLSLGPDGETGFVEQGGLNKGEKIDQEKTLLKAAMDKLAEEQRVMPERLAALDKEATNREVEAVQNQAAVLAVVDDSQQVGHAVLPTAQVLEGAERPNVLPSPTHAAGDSVASPMQKGEGDKSAE